MRRLIVALLTVVPLPAFAASISMDGLIETVIYLIIIGFALGLLLFLVRKAPFIPPEWKQGIEYFIYFVVVLFVINLLLGLVGHPVVTLR